MTRIEFNKLCLDDYREKLSKHYIPASIHRRIAQEKKSFEAAEFIGDDKGGILMLKIYNIAFIVYLYVFKEFRGSGIARTLVENGEQWARQNACDRLQAQVFEEVDKKFGILKRGTAIEITIQQLINQKK